MPRKACSKCQKSQAVRPGGLCNKCFSESQMPVSRPIEMVKVASIRIDGDTQARVAFCEATASDYAEVLKSGGVLPPIEVFFDGSHIWMGDGFHRLDAYRKAGMDEIPCHVHNGTRRDARLFAVGANAEHGLQRGVLDKRRAVEILLRDQEWGQKSTEWIAQHARVSWAFVDKVRREMMPESKGTVVGRDGRDHPSKKVAKAEDDQLPAREADEPTISLSNPVVENDGVEVYDHLGRVVPPKLREVFSDLSAFRSLIHQLGTLQSAIDDLQKRSAGARVHGKSVRIDLDNAQRAIRFAAPFAICPDCNGDGCFGRHGTCGGHGWLPEGTYPQLSPEQKAKCESNKKAA